MDGYIKTFIILHTINTGITTTTTTTTTTLLLLLHYVPIKNVTMSSTII